MAKRHRWGFENIQCEEMEGEREIERIGGTL